MRTTLVTGSAGFIGNFVAERFLDAGDTVLGLDNLNDYYDPLLKQARLDRLKHHTKFHQFKISLEDVDEIIELLDMFRPSLFIHLAAQAGVRYSLESPKSYLDSNISGFLPILEGARLFKPEHVVFASTSSVYGLDGNQPLSEHRGSNHPISLYAATKKANEVMAHSYSHLFEIPMTGLRFFTVYGPWGRPDMALFKFTEAILNDKPVQLFNQGKMNRDFTYIDDVVECVYRIANLPPKSHSNWNSKEPDIATSSAPFRLYNVGNSNPTELVDYVKVLELALGRKAQLEKTPMQPGDLQSTWSDSSDLKKLIDYCPSTPIDEGIEQFVNWYRDYYKI